MGRCLAFAVAAMLALVVPVAARADGDPASDFLLSGNVFLGYEAAVNVPEVGQLQTTTTDARRRGFPVKVVVITRPSDLGSVPSLYGHAQQYSDFLASEIRFVFKGTLVTVMGGRPGGVGVSGPGAKPAARRAVAAVQLPAQPNANTFLSVAAVAVRDVAAANGVVLPRLALAKRHSNTMDRLLLAAGAVGVAAAFAGLTFWRRRRGRASAP